MEMAKKKRKDSFKDLISIDRDKINDEMAQHAQNLYDVGVQIESLWRKLTVIQHKLEDKEAQLSATTRNKFKRSKIDITETAIKQMVRADEEYQELRNETFETEKLYRVAKMKKEVLKEKGEMLVNISHNVREEKKKENHNRT